MLHGSDRGMSEYIVEMKHITKTFPGIVANEDVSIQIRKGDERQPSLLWEAWLAG